MVRVCLSASLLSLALVALSPQTASAQNRPTPRTLPASSKAAPAIKPVINLVPGSVVREADKYEADLKTAFRPAKRSAPLLIAAGQRLLNAQPANPSGAAALFREAAFADPASAAAWTNLATALLQVTPDPTKTAERNDLLIAASSAAWRATERATTPPERQQALMLLSETMKRRNFWRPAISALKAAVAIEDTPSRRTMLDAMIAEHGFRILDTKIDADATAPRACVQFSESLATGPVDFSSFVTIDGHAAQAVAVDGKQLCIDGLKHGQTYAVQLRAGVPSAIDEKLIKTVDLSIYVRDRAPSVRAAGRAYVLPRTGQNGIPLTTVNADLLAIDIYRIGDRNLSSVLQSGDFQRQIASWDEEQIKDRSGQLVYSGELATPSPINDDVTTAFPVSDALGKLQPGVYVLTARVSGKARKANENDQRSHTSQWFVVSDLGVSAFTGRDGVHGFIRSLATADPALGVRVRLVARNNEILGEAQTDTRGYVHFDTGLKQGEGGLAPAFLSAEKKTGDVLDYSFLDLTTAAFDLSDRGVKGRDAPGPIDAFTFADRGVYRAGETVHLVSLVRDAQGRAAKLPVTLVVSRPDGVEYKRIALLDDQVGGRSSDVTLSSGAQSGTWHVRVYADPKGDAISTAAFLVEDFVPERLDMTLEPATAALEPGKPGTIKITGKYLYGPPAANLATEAEVVVKPSKKPVANLAGYRFGAADEKIAPARKTLENMPETDARGVASLPITLPEIDKTARPLEAEVIVRLREANGRVLERNVTLPVAASGPRIGIKPLFGVADATIPQSGEGETVHFEALLAGVDDKPIATRGMKWELLRLEQRWQWYNRDSDWTYDVQTSTRRVASGTVDSTPTEPAKIESKVGWGRYRLEVSSNDQAGAPILSSVEFTAGYWQDESADSPEMLDLAFDKPAYKSGDSARVHVTSKVAGKVVVAVINSGLVAMYEANIAAGGGDVSVPVTADWGAGAYLVATLYRPLDQTERRMPGRAIGLKWVSVDTDARTLKIALDAPQKIKSATKLTVPIKIAGLAPGEQARITVNATDVGVLNLTRYETPKPDAWFFGQRKLGVELRDFYSRLIDGMRAERGRLRSGGDGGADESMSMSGAPPVEATLAMTSGIVAVGADGTASVNFDLPGFNGTVRLNAVAWSEGRAGSASADVIVRDPVTVTASAPRFMTFGDQVRLALDLHNVEGPAGSYKIDVARMPVDGDAGGPQSLAETTVTLAAEQKTSQSITLKPSMIGPMPVQVSLTGPGGISVTRKLSFDVKPPAGDIRRVTQASLAAGGGKLTLSSDLLADFIPGTARVTMHVGPQASLNVPGLLVELDRYPYRCAEQTTSRAIALLTEGDVARRIGLVTDAEIKTRIGGAIERVLEMQDSSGAFGLWGPSAGDVWLTAYVTDFLLRARDAGHPVTPKALTLALDNLANAVAIEQEFTKGGENRAYALYVLARAGRAPVGELRYDVDTRLDKFATALSQAQLGAALNLTGDKERAEKAFAAALKSLDAQASSVAYRPDFGSGLRDEAAILTLASEQRLAKSETPRLVDVVAKAYASKIYTSTQEEAWMLLAAHAIGEQAAGASLTINGKPQPPETIRPISGADLAAGPLTIENSGTDATSVFVGVTGAALTPEPASSHGFTLERTFYTLDGKKIDLASGNGGVSALAQNERLVVVLKVDAADTGGRILLVDRLPAGFEIENPHLVDSGDVKSLDWLKTTTAPESTQFRDDRFVAAFDFFGNRGDHSGDNNDRHGPAKTATVAYIVRAVSPGVFVHPAATVEDMYRPDRFARTGVGKLTVLAK